jgi:hypothetical protein
MDSKARTFAVVSAVGFAALGCGAGERFRTAPASAGAGGAPATAGEAGRAAAAAGGAAGVSGGTAGAAGVTDHAEGGAAAVAGGGVSAAAPDGAAGAAGAFPSVTAGSLGRGGESASGSGPIGGVGGSSSPGAAGGDEPAGSAGLGGAAGSAGAGSGQTLLDDLPELYAEAVCASVTDCSPELGSLLFGANDCGGYVAEQVRNAWLPGLEEAIDGGTVLYSADELDGCLDAISRLGCRFDAHDYIPECEAAFEGTSALGEPCSLDAECQGDLYCKAAGVCPGTCSERAGSGDPCRRDTDCDARRDLYCTQNGKCVGRVEADTGCSPDVDRCVPGALCVGADASTHTLGQCKSVGSVFAQAEGSTCDPAQGELCSGDLTCTFLSADENVLPTCRKRATGTACRLAVPDPCPRQQYCSDIGSDDVVGSCDALPDDGEPCVGDPVFGKQCAQDNVCLRGTCVPLRTNGQDCDEDVECFSGACAGVCVPLTACDS